MLKKSRMEGLTQKKMEKIVRAYKKKLSKMQVLGIFAQAKKCLCERQVKFRENL